MKEIRTAKDILCHEVECSMNEFDDAIYSREQAWEAMEKFADQFKTKWTPISEGVPKKPKFPMLVRFFVIRDGKVWWDMIDWHSLDLCVRYKTISHYCLISPPELPNDL